MSISPISGGMIPPIGPAGISSPKSAKPESQFSQTLREAFENVNKQQQETSTSIENMLAGRVEDPLPVVQAVAKADLSFKLLLGVRNKVIEAYKQTMSMQI